jgi:hypothetical protein
MTNINSRIKNIEQHSVPYDSNRQQIISARKVLTRSVTLGSDARVEITVPRGCYEVGIKASSAVTFFESAATYTKVCTKADGSIETVTFGSGYSGTNMTFPMFNQSSFWLNGSGIVVTLLFSSIEEE